MTVFLLAFALSRQETLTIDDAVQIALQNAFTVRLAQSAVDEAQANQRAAEGGGTLQVRRPSACKVPPPSPGGTRLRSPGP